MCRRTLSRGVPSTFPIFISCPTPVVARLAAKLLMSDHANMSSHVGAHDWTSLASPSPFLPSSFTCWLVLHSQYVCRRDRIRSHETVNNISPRQVLEEGEFGN